MKKTKTNLIAFIALVVLPIISLIVYFKVDEQKSRLNVEKIYTIEYNYYTEGNISSNTESVKEGYITLPQNIKKEGYEFIGWTVNDKLVESPYYIKEDTEFIAKWEEIKKVYYKVTFKTNTSEKITSQNILSGNKISIPNQPTRKGYTFTGWKLNGKNYDFNNSVANNIILEASWKKNTSNETKYKVEFDLNGGKGNIKSQTIVSGGICSVPSVKPTRSGYTFVEWQYNGKSYNFNTKVTKNIVLTAKWKKNTSSIKKYTVTFKLNGGKGVSSKQTVISGSTVTIPANPTKSGYTFLGWYTSSKTKYDFSTKVKSNITLYALWAPLLNYKNNTNGKWVYINNPETLNKRFLADDDAQKTQIFKSSINGKAEIYYTHGVENDYTNKYYYAIRFYNPNTTSVTLKINKCGIVTGWNASTIWKQYYDGTCNIKGKTYTIKPKTSVMIYHNGSEFLYGSNSDQKYVKKVNATAFEGVLNVSSSDNLIFAAIWFKDIKKTYNSTYSGNVASNYGTYTPSRMYSGVYNKLPELTHNMTYDIYNQTPNGIMPVSYEATDGYTYITKPVTYFQANSKYKTIWRTNVSGGLIDTSASNNYTPIYYPTQYVGDFIKLKVPTETSSFTIGPYRKYKEQRNIKHAVSKNSMVGWPYNWANWGVKYIENLTFVNHGSKCRKVTLRLNELTNNQTINVIYDNTFYTIKENGSQDLWTITVPKNSSKTIRTEIILGGHSNGGITRELILEYK